MREIGQRHRSLCQYIARYTQTQGWPPSRREIKQALGFTSTSLVAYYLETLEQQGYLRCQPHISRGMLLTPVGYALAQQAAGAGPGGRRRTFSRPHEQPSPR